MKMKAIVEAAEKNDSSLWGYLVNAEVAFLKEAAKLIKKEAGGHAEKVEVKRGRSVAWLEYEGQDRSDMDMDFVAHLGIFENSAKLYVRGKKVSRGSYDEEKTYALGALTTNDVLLVFREHFGV